MNNLFKKLGAKVTLLSVLVAFLLSFASGLVACLIFSNGMRSLSYEIVASGVGTIKGEFDVEEQMLQGLANVMEATDHTEDHSEWYNIRRGDHDFAAIVDHINDQLLWCSSNYPAIKQEISHGIHAVDGQLICITGKTTDTVTYVVGTTLDYTDFVDEIKEQTSSEITLFLGDTRYNTTLLNDKGNRNVGTQMNADIWKKVQAGETVHDRVKIGKQEYYVHYEPFNDDDGKVIGALFAGYSSDTYWKVTSNAILMVIIVFLILVLLTTPVLVILLRNMITKPIEALMPVCDSIRTISLNTPPSDFRFSDDEVGKLAKGIEEAKDTLNSYITDMVNVLTHMADGDFTVDPGIEYIGDFKVVHDSIFAIHRKLGDVLINVTQSAEQVAMSA